MEAYDMPNNPSSAAPPLSGPSLQIEAEVFPRAVQVIGSEPEAMRWLGTPIRALDYSTPVSLLYDTAGRDAVLTVLGRLEHGIL